MTSELKVFNQEEINSLIPHLESLLAELETKHEDFRKLQDELFFEELLEDSEPSDIRIRQLEETLLKLEEQIQKICELGCLLRHPEKGLVDFLARKGEDWIYYCWRRGEKQIQFYHTLRGGYLERQPLDLSSQSTNA
ncbi:MAG: DUF2203 family protein [Candidatus Omnitrophica bacterium]|nr:DUF2203 family protein [Candidatus Omnitrophota bacterium]